MRIDDLNRLPQSGGIDRNASNRKPAEPNTELPVDRSEITSGADGDAEHSARVEALRVAVQTGAYEVNPEEVATAIVDAHLEK